MIENKDYYFTGLAMGSTELEGSCAKKSKNFAQILTEKWASQADSLTTAWYPGYWIDEFLQWNPSSYEGATEIFLASSDVWIPEFSLYYRLATPTLAHAPPTREHGFCFFAQAAESHQ
ncbi:hypothetical protein TELCIR_05239 [Teladorsagia circumcincta]|uniref:Neurotransmitter-gated ion-channel ligand-binding domain-containing protein n=1 Tax=Teladorsagia circumcincta TaxID=45464 RepID=A0A2G9URD3_TELCI|nr:hypothetical protein TELCIR_05239 [Teladorsagia circumcincta]